MYNPSFLQVIVLAGLPIIFVVCRLFNDSSHDIRKHRLASAILRTLKGTNRFRPPAEFLPVGYFSRVDILDLSGGQSFDRIGGIDEKDEEPASWKDQRQK